MKRDGTGYQRLLRWYPREWRDRYGEEFLAMMEDTLDGRRLTLRLRISVARGGLRERRHQVRTRLTGRTTAKRLERVFRLLVAFLAGSVAATIPATVKASPPPARAWLAAAAQDALIAVCALAGLCILAGGAVALPAFGRFLRAGGWPKIRRRAIWAAGATAAAGGGLTWLVVAPRDQTYVKLTGSWAYTLGVTVTAIALAIAFWLWAASATAAARHLRLAAGVRAAEKMVSTVIVATVLFMIPLQDFWYAAIQPSASQLFAGLSLFVLAGVATHGMLRAAVRRSRRLLAKAPR